MKCFDVLFMIYLFLEFNEFLFVDCKISDKRLCVDEKCSEPISKARTVLTYNAIDDGMLSCLPGDDVKVYSKSAGDRPDLWGAEIRGKRGYIPKDFLRETKIYKKDPSVIVPTEQTSAETSVNETASIEKSENEAILETTKPKGSFILSGVSADDTPPDINPQQAGYEVVDGTTLYNDPDPTTTESVPEITSNFKVETPPLDENVIKIEDSVINKDDKIEEKVPNEDEENRSPDQGSVEDNREDKEKAVTNEQINEDIKTNKDYEQNLFKNTLNFFSSSKENNYETENKRQKRYNKPEDYKIDNNEELKSLGSKMINNKELKSDKIKIVKKQLEDLTLSNVEDLRDSYKVQLSSDKDEESNTSKKKIFDNKINEESEISPTLEMSPSSPINLKTKFYQHQSPTGSDKINFKTKDNVRFENIDEKNSEQLIESIPESNLGNAENHMEKSKNISEDTISTEEISVTKLSEDTSNTASDSLNDDIANSFEESNADQVSTVDNEAVGDKEEEVNQTLDKKIEPDSIVNNASDLLTDTSTDSASSETFVSNVDSEGNVKSEDSSLDLSVVDDYSNSTIVSESKTEPETFKEEFKNKDNIDKSIVQETLPSMQEFKNEEDIDKPIVQEIVPAMQEFKNEEDIDKTIVQETVPSMQEFKNEEDIDKPMVQETVPSTQESSEKVNDIPITTAEESITNIAKDVPSDQDSTDAGNDTGASEINDFDVATESVEQVEEFSNNEEKDTNTVEVQEPEPVEGESEGMFSWLTSLFTGSEVPADQIDEVSNVVTSRQEDIVDNVWRQPNYANDEESCSMSGLSDSSCQKLVQEVKPDIWTASKSLNADFFMMASEAMLEKVPLTTALLLIITSVVVLIFTLGYYYIENHRRDGTLVARINTLERDLLVKKKENAILEDALTNTESEMKTQGSDLSEVVEKNEELSQELEELRIIRAELEEQVASLERELEAVADSGLEMHSLYESLTSQDSSQVLLQRVESLREKLDKQDAQITVLNQSLVEKNEEIEELQIQLSKSEEENKIMNDRFNKLKREKEEEAYEIKEKHRTLVMQLEELAETKALDESKTSVEMSKLRLSLEEAQHKLVEREAEVEAMKDTVRKLRATDQDEQLQELYEVATVQAKLTSATTERDEFREKFIEEEGARKLLEDHVRVISREVAELKENFETAEKEKIEALTKLKVLSNYFKEKESELQKEIGTQESLWLQKQGEDHTIYEQMRSLREENEKYKLQNESLKKEICEQESSFKIQLANVEQKAHESWVSSRQTERRLKEVQQEASQLRNRLTLSEKHSVNHDDQKQKMNESNGDPSSPPPSLMFSPTTSPPFMMYHGIPPGDFIPPPPLISPYAPDSRPPPLGRISSPPLDPRFSPPPPPMPYPPYDYSYGHHTPSPPPPLPHRTVHKPQPRDTGREKDTLSSYSQDTTEKPSRRSKR